LTIRSAEPPQRASGETMTMRRSASLIGMNDGSQQRQGSI